MIGDFWMVMISIFVDFYLKFCEFLFGDLFCKGVWLLMIMCLFVSVFMLICMVIECWYIIVKLLVLRFIVIKVLWVLFFIWIVGFGCVLFLMVVVY